MKNKIALAAGLAAIFAAAPAHAEEDGASPWIIRGAVTLLRLRDKIDLTAGGAPVPGADLHTKTHYTPTVHIGRMISRDFALSVTLGIPPHISAYGRKTLEPYGKLAELTYGPGTFTVQYHPVHDGVVRPYLGAGACYMHVFSTKDAAFQDVKIDDDLAPALEAGSDFMLKKNLGLFAEVKKSWLRTQAKGTFGGAPVVGDIALDPWAVSAGMVVRF